MSISTLCALFAVFAITGMWLDHDISTLCALFAVFAITGMWLDHDMQNR